MYNFPIQYQQPLFRPPSEAYSLILQITNGCSWNKCAFCEMYSSKPFKIKQFNEIQNEISEIANSSIKFNKIFLADGDAMVLSFSKLKKILEEVNIHFPKVRRISIYAKPKDIISKSINELKELKLLGLTLLYIGIESGDDEVLKNINKGETYKTILEALQKAKQAGIKLSVMILNGLGGKELSMQHAINSAKLINEIQPEYVSTLVISFPYGKDNFLKRYKGTFTMQNQLELIEEMGIFLEHTNLQQSVFRSDHASNYLILKGILSKDKDVLVTKINNVINNPEHANLRKEWERGL